MIRFGFKSLSIEVKRWRVRPLHRLQYSSLEQSKDFQELFSLIRNLNTWNKTSCCVKTAKWPFPHHQCPPSYLSALESAFRNCHVCSITGRNSRGMHPCLISDSVIRALQEPMLPIRLENKSNRQLKSTRGLDADSLPATNRDQAARSTPLSPTCADIAPFPD